jgi:hypothetical protein
MSTIEDRASEYCRKKNFVGINPNGIVPMWMVGFAESEFPREREEAVRQFLDAVQTEQDENHDIISTYYHKGVIAAIFQAIFNKPL